MKHLFACFFAIILIVSLNSCRKKDCPAPQLIKTDELSNTTWFGAYGRIYPEYRQLDTLIILAMKPEGFINVYEKDTVNGIKGKGYYTLNGKNFKATISLFRVNYPYILTGVINEEKTVLSGTFMYDANNTIGVFETFFSK